MLEILDVTLTILLLICIIADSNFFMRIFKKLFTERKTCTKCSNYQRCGTPINVETQKNPDTLMNMQTVTDSFDEEGTFTSYELERMAREKAFNERISLMKVELANAQSTKHTPTVADELDPMVKNIPHNAINPYTSLISEEYAD